MPDDDFEDAIADELLRIHVASTGPIIAATMAAATLVIYLLRHGVEPAWALPVWWLGFLVLMGVRFVASNAWFKDPQRRQRHRPWVLRFTIIVALGGIMWGLPSTLLYPTEASGLRPIAALVQMGISAAAVMSLTSVPVIYRSFFISMMVPSILWLTFTGGHLEHLTALALTLFTVLLLIGGARGARLMEDGLRLRHQLARALGEAEIARQRAEHANAAKDVFLTNMSHELRTPLHGILSFADMGLGRTQEDARQQQYFSRIRQSGDRLHRLINNLLDVSHHGARQTSHDNIELDLRHLLERLLGMRTERIQSRNLKISIHESGEAGKVMGQYLAVERMFDHLLGNAIRYANADTEVRITLEWHPAYVQITVADQGVGIPESELEAIFEHFRQSSRTRTEAGGTGLGLTIAREIAQRHGGNIVARNNNDGGADFVVQLPRAPEEETAAAEDQER
ncbi:MAG: HAMP domain-containing sensor histidine kinase [Rhodocyclaceae bacterium]